MAMTTLNTGEALRVEFRSAHEGIERFGRQPFPTGLMRANLNESPFAPLPGLAEAIAAEVPSLNRYGGDLAGATAAVARAFHRAEDEVILEAGSSSMLQNTIGALCDPGDEVVFSWLTFTGYVGATLAHSATPVRVPWREGGHDVERLIAAVTPRTKIVMLSSPNNPSGTALTKDEYDALVERIPANVLIVLDEAYADFVTSEGAFLGAQATDLPENVVVIKTMSKAMGLAGLRLGFMLGAPRLLRGFHRVNTGNTVSRLTMAAVKHCFSPESLAIVAQRVSYLAAERDRMEAEISAAGLPVSHSDASFLWLSVGAACDDLLAAIAADAGTVARAYPPEGVRYTVDLKETNDRVIAAVIRWSQTHGE